MVSASPTDNARPRLRALVLAAGHGMRLRPLTATVPKPLLPVLGVEVAARTLGELAAVGCEAVALNLHHLGDAIEQRFGDRFEHEDGSMPIHYSREPELLGTLGALAPLAEFFAETDEALIVNGDSLCRWPLAALLKCHRQRKAGTGAQATFLLTKRADPRRFGGGVGVDAKGRLVSFREGGPACAPAARRYVFAGAHVVDPEWFAQVEARPSDIVRDLYEPRLEAGEAFGAVVTRRRWHDLGTPGRYHRALLDLIRRGAKRWTRTATRKGSWISPQAQVHPEARVKRSVIEAGAVVEAGAMVDRSVVLPGARVGQGARLDKSLLSLDATFPAGGRVEGRLVWTPRDGAPVGPDDTLLAGVAYRPLDG